MRKISDSTSHLLLILCLLAINLTQCQKKVTTIESNPVSSLEEKVQNREEDKDAIHNKTRYFSSPRASSGMPVTEEKESTGEQEKSKPDSDDEAGSISVDLKNREETSSVTDKRAALLEKIKKLEQSRSNIRGRAHERCATLQPDKVEKLKKEEPAVVRYEKLNPYSELKTSTNPTVSGAKAESVKAGSHNDNEEFPFYQDFCQSNELLPIPYFWDISQRYVLRTLYADSSAAFNKTVKVVDGQGNTVFQAKTQASGEVVLFPVMDIDSQFSGISGYSILVDGKKPEQIVSSEKDRLDLVINEKKVNERRLSLQICFLIDATGSMKDEIEQLQDVIFSIHSTIIALPARPSVEFSIVAYRDKKDRFLVKGHPFTSDIDAFQVALESVTADGGGDYPEDIESGLSYCIDSLAWAGSSMKFVFLIGDAPPHLDFKDRNYLWAARRCRESGIMICPVGASGLTVIGEYVFRQMAVITNGEFVFLHYGEKGQSEGAATVSDPGKVSHHTGANYNARRLDEIVVDIISRELGYQSPPDLVKPEPVEPENQTEFLEIRLASLLRQIIGKNRIEQKAIAVCPIVTRDSSLLNLSDYLFELTLEKLPLLSKANLVERKRLEEVFKEMALSLSGATSVDQSRIGNLLNADYLLLAQLHFLGSVRVCHMRLVESGTGSIVGAGRIKM